MLSERSEAAPSPFRGPPEGEVVGFRECYGDFGVGGEGLKEGGLKIAADTVWAQHSGIEGPDVEGKVCEGPGGDAAPARTAREADIVDVFGAVNIEAWR